MPEENKLNVFLAQYDEQIQSRALKLREVIFKNVPKVTEQVDVPAKMIAYSYGQKYSEMICTIIPSKKGIKLGFYKGNELPDPSGLLQGSGKISRYVEINSDKQIESPDLKKLLSSALAAYKQRLTTKK